MIVEWMATLTLCLYWHSLTYETNYHDDGDEADKADGDGDGNGDGDGMRLRRCGREADLFWYNGIVNMTDNILYTNADVLSMHAEEKTTST